MKKLGLNAFGAAVEERHAWDRYAAAALLISKWSHPAESAAKIADMLLAERRQRWGSE
jgi:hypothetical protein